MKTIKLIIGVFVAVATINILLSNSPTAKPETENEFKKTLLSLALAAGKKN